mgnify:FL=1
MMMPANYSAIAENELTYVNGGAIALGDILADKLEVSNWKKFNTNMVTLIGNAFMGGYINNTLGKLFSGSYHVGDMTGTWFGSWTDKFQHSTDLDTTKDILKITANNANTALNWGLNIVGNAAAIYNLATGTVANGASKASITAKVS